MTCKNRKKLRIFMYGCLDCFFVGGGGAEGFFCSLNVLYGGLGIIEFFYQKI
jgi:hypothetical protein